MGESPNRHWPGAPVTAADTGYAWRVPPILAAAIVFGSAFAEYDRWVPDFVASLKRYAAAAGSRWDWRAFRANHEIETDLAVAAVFLALITPAIHAPLAVALLALIALSLWRRGSEAPTAAEMEGGP